MLLLALWMPVTSHGLLEDIGWIHHHDVDPDPDQGPGHDAADGTCQIESGACMLVKGEQASNWSSFYFLSTAVAALPEISLALPSKPDFPGPSPPELSRTWQFSFRTALPVRAPSVAS